MDQITDLLVEVAWLVNVSKCHQSSGKCLEATLTTETDLVNSVVKNGGQLGCCRRCATGIVDEGQAGP